MLSLVLSTAALETSVVSQIVLTSSLFHLHMLPLKPSETFGSQLRHVSLLFSQKIPHGAFFFYNTGIAENNSILNTQNLQPLITSWEEESDAHGPSFFLVIPML